MKTSEKRLHCGLFLTYDCVYKKDIKKKRSVFSLVFTLVNGSQGQSVKAR